MIRSYRCHVGIEKRVKGSCGVVKRSVDDEQAVTKHLLLSRRVLEASWKTANIQGILT